MMLYTAGLIGIEALAQYLVGVVDNDKCVRGYLLHPFFQVDDLILGKSAQDHLMGLMGKATLAVQEAAQRANEIAFQSPQGMTGGELRVAARANSFRSLISICDSCGS